MKRSFNYTERTKLAQRSVDIRLYNDQDGVQMFDADLDLTDYKHLVPGSKIYVEAYYRTALMRFDAGTFDPEQPLYQIREQRLDELQDPVVYFRIKIVDVSKRYGRLIGGLERVKVFNQTTKQVDRVGLLPVNFGADLGNRVWAIEFAEDDSDPMLLINKHLKVDDSLLREFVARNPAFMALVYPEVMRQILKRLVEEGVDTSDEDTWQYKWTKFTQSYGVGAPPNADDDDVTEWIDRAVDAVCSHLKLKTSFESFLEEAK